MVSPTKWMLAPRYWGFHLLALVLTMVAFGFGNWQWNSWQAHRQVHAVDLASLTPEPINAVFGSDDPFTGNLTGQPVVVEGTWLPDSTLLVTNRSRRDRDAAWVVTPLAIGGPDGPAILVVRGLAADIDDVPDPPTGEARFVVNLQPGEGTGAVDDDPTDNVLPQLRIADALNHVDRDLYSGYGVVTTELDDDGWPVGEDAVNAGTDDLAPAEIDKLPATKTSSGLRNFLYCIEWFVFGLFVVYIWWHWVKDELKRREETQVTDGAGPDPDATGD